MALQPGAVVLRKGVQLSYFPSSISRARLRGLSHGVFILEAWTGPALFGPWVNCGEEKGAQRHEARQVPYSTLAAIKNNAIDWMA